MTVYQRRPVAFRTRVAGPARRPTPPDTRPTAELDLAWLDRDGIVHRDRRALPDIPLIEAAVSSIARGTLLQGPRGGIAVEDLVPGDRVAARGGGMVRVVWTGARTYAGGQDRPVVFRVAARAFGASGPEQDVLLGAQAHLLLESPRCRALVGGPLAFAPIAAFEDGRTVAALAPPGDITVYGIACDAQEAILAAGLPIESYHPARALGRDLSRNVLADLDRLLPQAVRGDRSGKPQIPCLTFSEAQGLAVSGF